MLFSIIIPVYNKGRYIGRCIRSIVEQDFKSWELILIDDGSTDRSGELCDFWATKDKRIQCYHQSNRGVCAARNSGLQKIRGEYVQFIDADDWLSPSYFDFLKNELKRTNFPDLLISGFTRYWESGQEVQVIPPLEGIIEKKTFFHQLIKEQHKTGVYGAVCNKLTKVSIINKYNLRFGNHRLLEDYDFFLDVYYRSSSIVCAQQCGYFYRQNAENSSFSPDFVFHYPDVMSIRVKAYNLVKEVCGVSDSDLNILIKDLSGHFLGMYLEEKNPSKERLIRMYNEVNSLLPPEISLVPAGCNINTRIVSFLLRNKLWSLLTFYLKSRRIAKCGFKLSTDI